MDTDISLVTSTVLMKFCGLVHLFHTDSFQWGRAKGGSHQFPAQHIYAGYGNIKLGKDDDCS